MLLELATIALSGFAFALCAMVLVRRSRAFFAHQPKIHTLGSVASLVLLAFVA
jgi:hypothetical protein